MGYAPRLGSERGWRGETGLRSANPYAREGVGRGEGTGFGLARANPYTEGTSRHGCAGK